MSDDSVEVTVQVASVPDGRPVEVPGLGLFKNNKPRMVKPEQVMLFNNQPGPHEIDPQGGPVTIQVPPPEPEPEPEVVEEPTLFDDNDNDQEV